MIGTISIIATGLQASSTRLGVSADNTANQFSTLRREKGELIEQPYEAKRIDQMSLQAGGVHATVALKNPATIQRPVNGEAVDYPNVNEVDEVVNQQLASYDFKANLNVIKRSDAMMEGLLDITA